MRVSVPSAAVTIRVPFTDLQLLDKMCSVQGDATRSAMVRRAIRLMWDAEYREREEPAPKRIKIRMPADG